jgi:hypothetical protein
LGFVLLLSPLYLLLHYNALPLNDGAGKPSLLNKEASTAFLKQYLTYIGFLTLVFVTMMDVLLSVIVAVAG